MLEPEFNVSTVPAGLLFPVLFIWLISVVSCVLDQVPVPGCELVVEDPPQVVLLLWSEVPPFGLLELQPAASRPVKAVIASILFIISLVNAYLPQTRALRSRVL